MKMVIRESSASQVPVPIELDICFTPDSAIEFRNGIRGRLFDSQYSQQEFVLRGSTEHKTFGGDWTVFFRIKEAEIRVMHAHPDANSWVATVLMPRNHYEDLLSRIENHGAWETAELRPANQFNNLNLRLSVQT